MDPRLKRLLELVPPPTEPDDVPDVDWPAFEKTIGVRLPTDYKELIEIYGLGLFGHELGVDLPNSANENMDLVRRNNEELDALRYCQKYGERIPYRIERGNEELFNWGRTDNGDVCYWVMTGDDPDQWTVTVNETRSPSWYPFNGSLSEFIVAAFVGNLEEVDHPLGGDWDIYRFKFVRESDTRYESE